MEPSTPKPTDAAPHKPTDAPNKAAVEHKTELSASTWDLIKENYVKPAASYVEGNLLAPFYNESAVKIGNTIITKAQDMHVNVSKLDAAAVPEAPIKSLAFGLQTLSSTAGSLVGIVATTALVHKYLRVGGESAALMAEKTEGHLLTAQTIRNYSSQRQLANITGAAIYGAAIDPEQGQTRLGNAVAGAAGMAAFEGANKLAGTTKFLDAKAMGIRAVTGAAIGPSQQFLGNLVSTGHADFNSDHYEKAAASGAFMNVLMPGMMKLPEAIAPKLGINAYADQFAANKHQEALGALPKGSEATPGSWADKNAAQLAIEHGKTDITARARSSESAPTSVDHTNKTITLKDGASVSEFIEENAHLKIARDAKHEAGFTNAAHLLDSGRTQEARQAYTDIRVAQELEAHTARQNAIESTGVKGESTNVTAASIAREYARQFSREADLFMLHEGNFRPVIDFSQGDGGHGPGHGSSHAGPSPTESVLHAAESGNHTGAHGGTMSDSGFVQGVGIGPHPDATSHVNGATDARQDAGAIRNGEPAGNVNDRSTWPEASLGRQPQGPKGTFYYQWNDGATVWGHENVYSAEFLSPDSNLTLLKTRDPISGQIASTIEHYATPKAYLEGDGTERFTYNELEHNLHTGHNVYSVAKGGDWLPDNSTWETYPRRVALEIGGQPLWVSSIVRHNDASGKIEYGLSDNVGKLTEYTKPQLIGDHPEEWKPGDPVALHTNGKPAFFLFQRSQTHFDGSTTDYVYDPRKLDASVPREQLTPDFSIDSQLPGQPLKTSLGDFERVQRMPDQLRYENDNEAKIVKFDGDKLDVTSYKTGETPTRVLMDSIKETYPNGRDTAWGVATEIEIKPKSMIATLKDGGKVEIFNSQAYPDGAPYEHIKADGTPDERFANNRFGNVRRVDTAPDGTVSLIREMKSSEGLQYSTITVPPTPFNIHFLPQLRADAVEEFPGTNRPITHYLSDGVAPDGTKIPYGTLETKLDGFTSDLLGGPYDAVWRYSRGLAYLKNVENGASNWTKKSILFADNNNNSPPFLIDNNDINDTPAAGKTGAFSDDELWNRQADGSVIPKPLLTESYPFGQPITWGTALTRAIYHDGTSAFHMKDQSLLLTDANGKLVDKYVMNGNGQYVQVPLQ